MSIVLGFDTSLTVSGCARVDLGVGDGGRVEALRWETWRARAPQPIDDTVLGERRRIRHMLREILALVPDFFDLAVVEGPAPGGKFSGKADERSGLRWMLIDQLCARGEVVLVDPQTRAVLASSRGVRRRKNETATAAKHFVLDAVRLLVPGAHIPDHNVGDAVALAYAGAVALGVQADYSDEQSKAHAKVAWPVEAGVLATEGMQ